MKYYINRKIVYGAYGGGNLWVKAAYEMIPTMGHEILRSDDFKASPDVILIAGIDSDGYGISAEQAIIHKMHKSDVKLVLRVNENDARKNTNHVDPVLIKLSEFVDATVFVSHWLKDYFLKKGWKCSNNEVIYNGVDSEIFKSQPKFTNNKINIVAHHWSNNRMKGFDVYEQLDNFVGENSDFTFTYIGRENGTFRNTRVVKPLFGKELGAELGRYDVYVSASRWDPGPNHILESLASNIPTYVHVDGGGAVEFAGRSHAFNSWEELQQILLNKKFQNNTAITLLDWKTCVSQYMSLAERLHDNSKIS